MPLPFELLSLKQRQQYSSYMNQPNFSQTKKEEFDDKIDKGCIII